MSFDHPWILPAIIAVLSAVAAWLLATLLAASKRRLLQTALAVMEEREAELARQLQQARDEIGQLRQQQREEQQRQAALQAENAELRTSQKEREEHVRQQFAKLAEQEEQLKREFQNLANRIFEEKGKVFNERSKESLDTLLNPFRTQIEEFRKKVEDIHHKDTQQQSALRAELQHLKEMNRQITEEAHQLATALKGQKKAQGNWGELILENVLERSGLRKDIDYKREVSFNTEDGRSRPDAIVYLPDEKHLVIDAKVSLNAYTRYVNAEDEAEREQALKEHVSSVANRIKELADRNYFELPGLNSPEMVFMFIPIESAFVEALRGDESLFQKALEQNVLVATPTTLLTSLNIVRQLWRFEDQNKHTAELADKAGKVYDKLRLFVESMDDVGSALDKAKESYRNAYARLYSGRGNLIKQAEEFRKLGVAVKSELPKEIRERGELELEHQAGVEGDKED
ncbi:MAG: DNA recombination protein RmuC [Chromatiales bacterium]|nr:DNA recombination protein RmuC [Chromatiales bacterium]